MSSHERRPPSGRDFAVFEAVIVGGKTTRQTAEQFQLSQTRVCQIVERLRQWQAEVAPQNGHIPNERLLQLAKAVASGRLDHLYSEMMEAWRRSQGEVQRRRVSRFGDDITTTITSLGDPKYLLAAMRLAMAQSELGVFGGLACASEEDAGEEQLSGRPETRPTAAPPSGDCSENRVTALRATCGRAMQPLVRGSAQITSAEPKPRQSVEREQFFRPVQQPSPVGESTAATMQMQVTPDQLGLSVAEILSRHGRRSRRAG